MTTEVLAQPLQCKPARASRFPAYATQGSWSPDGSRLLLVDPVYEDVHTYAARDGRYLGPIPAPAAVDQRSFFPISSNTLGDLLVVETFPQRLLFLSERFQVTAVREPLRELQAAASAHGGLRTRAGGGSGGATLASMFQWSFAGSDLVACGDIQQADGAWMSGIARFPIDASTGVRTYAVSDFKSPEWIFCRLGFPYIAAIGDTAYIFLFNEEPGIYESKPGASELHRLDYQTPAPLNVSLPEFTSSAEFVATMAQVERQSLPVGLYAWDGSLFVLYRSLDDHRSEARWLLHEVSPATGKLLGEARIYSTATHLMLIPGDTWAVVEKGPLVEIGKQATRQIRMLPGSTIPRPLRGVLCGGT